MIIINILDSIFHKLVVAAFITFVTFGLFAGMSFAVTKTTATALVSSRLDYCNFLYYNVALKDILKLQHLQNCLARVVPWSPRFSHSLSLLKSLHWLPVRYCIIFKIQLSIMHFHPSNQHIYIHCSLLQDSPDIFDHLILIYFLFPVLRQMSELELFQLLHRLCRTHSLLVLSLWETV